MDEWPSGEPRIPDEVCRPCSGTGLATDNAAFRRQTCTTEDDCRNCGGTGRVEAE